jgi:hypothetical protein
MSQTKQKGSFSEENEPFCFLNVLRALVRSSRALKTE